MAKRERWKLSLLRKAGANVVRELDALAVHDLQRTAKQWQFCAMALLRKAGGEIKIHDRDRVRMNKDDRIIESYNTETETTTYRLESDET